MSGHKNFRILQQELDRKLQSDPEARFRSQQYERAVRDALAIAALREACSLPQADRAEPAVESSIEVQRVEHSDNVYLSTLSGYVAALGGRLELTAVFPDQAIRLTPPDDVAAQTLGAPAAVAENRSA